jgi:hypothetical protein
MQVRTVAVLTAAVALSVTAPSTSTAKIHSCPHGRPPGPNCGLHKGAGHGRGHGHGGVGGEGHGQGQGQGNG